MQITEAHNQVTIASIQCLRSLDLPVYLFSRSLVAELLYPYSLLLVVVALLLITMGISVTYYKRIRRVREEYEEARSTVGDIIISFNREFRRQDDKLRVVTHKVEVVSSNSEKIAKKLAEYDKLSSRLAGIIEEVPAIDRKLSAQIEQMSKKIDLIKKTQKIAELQKTKYEVLTPEAKIEAVIPIKKEKALAPLTATELNVLEIIAKEGGKTAPEIRERIGLTREHTARLMKKLYEDGYLERSTNKMPYTYHLKEEMQKILKKRGPKV
jgi:DNA-binding MarR family transcriptional regulator